MDDTKPQHQSNRRVLVISDSVVIREGLHWVLMQGHWAAKTWAPKRQQILPDDVDRFDLLVVDVETMVENIPLLDCVDQAAGQSMAILYFSNRGNAHAPAGMNRECLVNGFTAGRDLCQLADMLVKPVTKPLDVFQPVFLTDREREVFSLLGAGMSNIQIASEMDISVKTVETHKENIKKKMSVRSNDDLRIQAAAWIAQTSI